MCIEYQTYYDWFSTMSGEECLWMIKIICYAVVVLVLEFMP